MASPRISTPRGFTLIELVIVVGLLAIIGSFTLVLSFNSYKGYLYRTDRDVLVAALQHARALAIGNVCSGTTTNCTDGRAHGVAIRPVDHPESYVIFQGPSYANRDQAVDSELDSAPTTVFPGGTDLSEVVFKQLSGSATTSGTITMTDDAGRSSVITIGPDGQISWTK